MILLLAPALALALALSLAAADGPAFTGPAFTGTVPQPNAALDAAHACLRAEVGTKLSENAPEPVARQRWDWALQIADRCKAQINAAAESHGAVSWSEGNVQNGITKQQLLRSEALYFVDRLIREHFEAQP